MRIYYEWELQNYQKGTNVSISLFLLRYFLGSGSSHISPVYGIISYLYMVNKEGQFRLPFFIYDLAPILCVI